MFYHSIDLTAKKPIYAPKSDLSTPSTFSTSVSALIPRASASLPSTLQPLTPQPLQLFPEPSSSLTSIVSRQSPPPKKRHRPDSAKRNRIELRKLLTQQQQQLEQIKGLMGKASATWEGVCFLWSARKSSRRWWGKFSPKSAPAEGTAKC